MIQGFVQYKTVLFVEWFTDNGQLKCLKEPINTKQSGQRFKVSCQQEIVKFQAMMR